MMNEASASLDGSVAFGLTDDLAVDASAGAGDGGDGAVVVSVPAPARANRPMMVHADPWQPLLSVFFRSSLS